MINVQWVNYNTSPDYVIPDLGWLSFKSYYEENGKRPEHVNWLFPVYDSGESDIEGLTKVILDQNPDLVAFSTYVWNVGLNHRVARLIKEKSPNTMIVFGGPHIQHKYQTDYFENNLHVDLVCHVDAYGEIFFTDLLDQLTNNEFSPSKITYAVYPTKSRMQLQSTKTFYKRDYKWPRKIYEKNKAYIDELVKRNSNAQNYYLAETSRGCPFGCVFCEWGGGISSKVSFKPTEYVLEDLDFFLDNYKPYVVGFTDANFGIIERDVDIVKHLATKRPEHPQLREFYLYGQTKVNKQYLFEIYEELAKIDLVDELVKISIQDFDQEVLDNIDRTDVDWPGHRDYLKDLLSRYNFDHLTVKYEMILGLPGSTLDKFYQSFNYLGSTNPHRYPWWLLPTSPGADPAYRKRFKLETVKNKVKWAHNENDYNFAESNQLIHDPRFSEETEIVVGTSTYSRLEWAEMYLVTELYSAMLSSGLILAPITYIDRYRPDIKLSAALRELLTNILYGKNILDDFQKHMIDDISTQFVEKVHSTEVVDITRVNIPDIFPIKGDLSVKSAWLFVLMIDIHAFYRHLKEWAKQFNDPILLESIEWNSEFLLTLEYDPTEGKRVTANRDWHEIIFHDGSLKEQRIEYEISDKHLTQGGYEITWHNYPIEYRIIKDFIKYCGSVEKLKTFQVFTKKYL
jgi:putative methyltransferase